MISVVKLSFGYHDKNILNELNLTIQPNEFVALCGCNGAGKTTLLKLLTGEFEKNSYQGSIYINGKAIWQYPSIELAKIRAVLPQKIQLNFAFSVYEIVQLGLFSYGYISAKKKEQWVRWALNLLEIEHFYSKPCNALSGGEQQKVQLARVLVQLLWEENNSLVRYLFLDEPTSNLDMKSQHLLLNVIKQLKTKNIGVIAVLHDLNLATSYADRVLLLKEGAIFKDGFVKDVCTSTHLSEVYDHPIHIDQQPNGKPLVVPISESTKMLHFL
jgi:iron complex transport system ATP-binding protein